MARRDYSEDDDFYFQGFEKEGVLSLWIGLKDRHEEKNLDTLQDLCGVGYYRLSDQESNFFEYQMTDLSRLLADLSYSKSYIDNVLLAARNRALKKHEEL